MCTILTIDNISDIFLNQVRVDFACNPHGLAILAYDGANYDLLKTASIEVAISFLTSRTYERVWVHTRNATTWARGVTATHGFIEGEHVVFHNGVLRSPGAQSLPVDSMMLCDILKLTRPENLQKTLSAMGEGFANVMIVDTKLDSYTIIRQSAGSLFTDNKGNYSTNPFGDITVPVATETSTLHRMRIPVVTPEDLVGEHWSRYFDARSPAPAPVIVTEKTTEKRMSSARKRELKRALRGISYPDFLDLVYDNKFEGANLADPAYFDFQLLLTKEQRSWLTKIQEDHRRQSLRFGTDLSEWGE